MTTISTAGYVRQPDIRQAPPATVPFDRGSDHRGDYAKHRDNDHANDAPASGMASVQRAASPQHALNMSV
jgi:hypothetical protein